MCARFTVDHEVIQEVYTLTDRQSAGFSDLSPGEIRPTDLAPVISEENGTLVGNAMQFGIRIGQDNRLIINSRKETIDEKPSFRDLFRAHRCVIPAVSFVEWDAQKQPVSFTLPDRQLLFLAGIFRPEGPQNAFTVITAPANASVERIHPRMPVILQREDLEVWLSGNYREIIGKALPSLAHDQRFEQLSLF